MDMRIPPLRIETLLESKPSEIQNLSSEIGGTALREVIRHEPLGWFHIIINLIITIIN